MSGVFISYRQEDTSYFAGRLHLADAGNQRVRRIDPAGVITTLAQGA